MTRLEYERILKPSWQIVCHVNSIPNPGDFVAVELGSDSVVAVRTSQGTIRTFHNVCRHRGARILDGAGNCPGAITCPYHGWSYKLSGELIGMPVRESFPGLDRSQFALKPVTSQVMFGFCVCIARGHAAAAGAGLEWLRGGIRAAPLRGYGPVGSDLHRELGLRLEDRDGQLSRVLHVPIGHPGLFRMFTRITRTRSTCRPGLPVASAGSATGSPRNGASACTNSSWAR